ncbi:phage antirepressor [Enterococcus cecorum]|uniref:phage antirepressor n=1 Tax=Enterococcus cecorum TaxID=44008 RepID=UPI002ACA8DBF|nr:phage antirepressor [Enterococcus cecorum]MDZ5503199.1 phage antirepressor [Enterococcus cecorum]MDZ5557052.1 phage antirepressor [Enterococcus cecorum]MDZ5559061.1 phage antirepressor [Enterococcus cecorum]MDZ5592003.1 phage antirepressor [Enterococcus cecorum]
MMEIQTFNFENQQVRTIEVENEPWFVANDVTTILGLSNTTVALQRLDEDERAKYNLGRQGMTNIVNEYGLYNLVLASRKPEAKQFKRWITHEVLPAIRKHGGYLTEQKLEEALLNPDTLINLATQLKQEREGRLIAEQRVNELTPKATYYDLVLQNNTLLSITKIAKDYGWSGTKMNHFLHENKVQFKQGDTWLLYQKYADKGYTQSKTNIVDGGKKTVMHTYWTQKGRLFIYELMKSKGYLPVIERETA